MEIHNIKVIFDRQKKIYTDTYVITDTSAKEDKPIPSLLTRGKYFQQTFAVSQFGDKYTQKVQSSHFYLHYIVYP